MTLAPGTCIGPYEIVAPLGAGGMGEVYRAHDTRLDRDVAIKILPEAFAADAERLARFGREAKTLASLNHPNIGAIYGIEPAGATGNTQPGRVFALVMELVEGDDLADRIARGPIPIDETLAIARQIAGALEAAHERGIIHRDLKPANIKVRADGTVKVLDFGLAKALDPSAGSNPDLMNSPTITSPATQLGTILGTAAYMAPEQAKGRAVDRRADIWAFGVILYEMLTGRACFGGDTVGEVMASVMKDAPDLTALPAQTPAALSRLLARCLEKDPRRRLSAIGDARWDLEESASPEAAHAAAGPRPWLLWLSSAAAVAAMAVAAWALATRTAVGTQTVEGRFTIELPADAPIVIDDAPRVSDAPLAVSPDGRYIVYVAPHGASTRLFVRALADETPRALEGTEGARMPFFSPDSESIGFFAGGKLKRTRVTGGTPDALADASRGGGASWGNGEIVFSPTGDGLFAIPDRGGAMRRLTSLDAAAGDDQQTHPQVLPAHGAVLFTVMAWSREAADIVIADLKTGERRLVQEDATFGRYVPAADGSAGHLLFVRDDALLAAPFDPGGRDRAGTPVTVLDGVRERQFDISAAGVLAYTPGTPVAAAYSLVWVDRAGEVTTINDLPRGYEDLHLSPDGRRVATTIEETGEDSPAHVWIADTTRRTLARFTFEGFSRDPVWAPDGQSIVYGSKRGRDAFGLYVQPLDGRSPAALVWASTNGLWPDPQSWAPDGTTVVFNTKDGTTGDDIWTLDLDTGAARPWLATPASENNGRLSPDGRWMAYHSNASGRDEIYVQPYPGPGAKRLVSQGGGLNPIWSRDGREIFYRHDADLLVVPVDTTAGFTSGSPVVMFSGRYRLSGRDFDVSPDGTRFVMMRVDGPRTGDRMRVLLNWRRLLEEHLKGSR